MQNEVADLYLKKSNNWFFIEKARDCCWRTYLDCRPDSGVQQLLDHRHGLIVILENLCKEEY